MTVSRPRRAPQPQSTGGPFGGDPRSDAELAREAGAGKPAAFEALYRRHAPAAWRLASAVAANPEDAADAVSEAFTRVLMAMAAGRLADGNLFRPYLLTATRNAAIDLHRRADRVRPSDRLEELQLPAPGRSASERVDVIHDSSVVASAFRGLPERWRTVLWLTEVEGKPAREVATLLGLTANTAAQLASRARGALREKFVQAQLRQPVSDDCRFCVDRLGGYITGRLSPRDLAKVDQHLTGCADCRERAAELDDLGTSLRRAVLPLPLLLGPAAIAKWKLASAATGAAPTAVASTAGTASLAGGTSGAGTTFGAGAGASGASMATPAAGGATSWTSRTLPRLQRPLAVASTGIFALAVISSSVVSGPADVPGTAGRRAPLTDVVPTPPQVVEDVALAVTRGLEVLDSLTGALTGRGGGGAGGAGANGAGGGASGGAGGGSAGGGSGGPDPGSPTTPAPAPEPLVRAGLTVAAAGQPVGATSGSGEGSCTGATVLTARIACQPPSTPTGTLAAKAETDGSAGGGLLSDRSTSVAV